MNLIVINSKTNCSNNGIKLLGNAEKEKHLRGFGDLSVEDITGQTNENSSFNMLKPSKPKQPTSKKVNSLIKVKLNNTCSFFLNF